MTQHAPKLKTVGEDISYPVINQLDLERGVHQILDDDRDLVCECYSSSVGIIITGLLNEHRPNEWKP